MGLPWIIFQISACRSKAGGASKLNSSPNFQPITETPPLREKTYVRSRKLFRLKSRHQKEFLARWEVGGARGLAHGGVAGTRLWEGELPFGPAAMAGSVLVASAGWPATTGSDCPKMGLGSFGTARVRECKRLYSKHLSPMTMQRVSSPCGDGVLERALLPLRGGRTLRAGSVGPRGQNASE